MRRLDAAGRRGVPPPLAGGDVLERLGYPEAATRRVPIAEIGERLKEANHAVGNRSVDQESFAYGYWHGVQDERREYLRRWEAANRGGDHDR